MFLMDAKMRGVRPSSVCDVDRALARDLEYRCFGLHQGVQRGKDLVHGMHHIFPEMRGQLVLSLAALTGWSRIHVAGEGRPMSASAVFLVIERNFQNGDVWEGIITFFALDAYLRESGLGEHTPGKHFRRGSPSGYCGAQGEYQAWKCS